MTTPQKVHIVGIGDDGLGGLTSTARSLIDRAELVLGLDPDLQNIVGEQITNLRIGDDIDAAVSTIDHNPSQRIVILATGDPLFYGTARYLCDRLGKDRFEVVPHVSSMQLAFARVKESWDEAYLTNLAAHDVDHVVEKARTAEMVGLFTTEQAPPSLVAKKLLDHQIEYFTAYVCENLGSPDERVTQAELAEVADHDYAPLNVMIFVRKPNVPDRPLSMKGHRLFGNRDEAFLQSRPKRGLLTPAEVRCMALAELDLGPRSIVWDVGAGSGCVGIEAAQIASGGAVYAIEMDPEDHQLISANAQRFGVANLIPVLGRAPDAWSDLPSPDAVFVGGAGRTVDQIVRSAFTRLRSGGRLVANVGTIENVAAVRKVLLDLGVDAHVWMVNLARDVFQLERLRLESQNPTFLIGAIKVG